MPPHASIMLSLASHAPMRVDLLLYTYRFYTNRFQPNPEQNTIE